MEKVGKFTSAAKAADHGAGICTAEAVLHPAGKGPIAAADDGYDETYDGSKASNESLECACGERSRRAEKLPAGRD